LFEIMALNTRMPDKLAGDLQAQVAACRTAEKSFQKLVERHGSAAFRQILASLHNYAERMMRAEIAALPDGTWSFTDYLDGTGLQPEPIPLKVTVTIAGDDLAVDWTGSAPQVPAAINCPSPFVKSAVHLIMKCLAREDIPNFEGYTRPFRIILPEGTIVNPTAPAACAARAIIGWRAIDTLSAHSRRSRRRAFQPRGEGGVAFPAISGFSRDAVSCARRRSPARGAA
jgi:N-methylhydantoinase B